MAVTFRQLVEAIHEAGFAGAPHMNPTPAAHSRMRSGPVVPGQPFDPNWDDDEDRGEGFRYHDPEDWDGVPLGSEKDDEKVEYVRPGSQPPTSRAGYWACTRKG